MSITSATIILGCKQRIWRVPQVGTIKGGDLCIAGDHQGFTKWFPKAALATPVVAALVVCSGFAGHPLNFLQLIDDSDKVVCQSEFNKRVKYIDELKKDAGNYVREYAEAYKTAFVSKDELVQARLHQIQTGKGVKHEVVEIGASVNGHFASARSV